MVIKFEDDPAGSVIRYFHSPYIEVPKEVQANYELYKLYKVTHGLEETPYKMAPGKGLRFLLGSAEPEATPFTPNRINKIPVALEANQIAANLAQEFQRQETEMDAGDVSNDNDSLRHLPSPEQSDDEPMDGLVMQDVGFVSKFAERFGQGSLFGQNTASPAMSRKPRVASGLDFDQISASDQERDSIFGEASEESDMGDFGRLDDSPSKLGLSSPHDKPFALARRRRDLPAPTAHLSDQLDLRTDSDGLLSKGAREMRGAMKEASKKGKIVDEELSFSPRTAAPTQSPPHKMGAPILNRVDRLIPSLPALSDLDLNDDYKLKLIEGSGRRRKRQDSDAFKPRKKRETVEEGEGEMNALNQSVVAIKNPQTNSSNSSREQNIPIPNSQFPIGNQIPGDVEELPRRSQRLSLRREFGH